MRGFAMLAYTLAVLPVLVLSAVAGLIWYAAKHGFVVGEALAEKMTSTPEDPR